MQRTRCGGAALTQLRRDQRSGAARRVLQAHRIRTRGSAPDAPDRIEGSDRRMSAPTEFDTPETPETTETPQTREVVGHVFTDLPAELLEALRLQGIVTPTAVQEAVIPDGMAGHDVLGRAQTGSGKTLAFG